MWGHDVLSVLGFPSRQTSPSGIYDALTMGVYNHSDFTIRGATIAESLAPLQSSIGVF